MAGQDIITIRREDLTSAYRALIEIESIANVARDYPESLAQRMEEIARIAHEATRP